MRASVAMVPPLVAAGAAPVAVARLGQFRVRRLALTVPQLPEALEGLCIAHLTDTHIGRLTRPGVLDRVVECTNELNADLVFFTGDLSDDAPASIEAASTMLGGLRSRHGRFLCEGNHDGRREPEEFAESIRRSGFALLRNEAETITIRGQRVQVMGLRWRDATLRMDGLIAEDVRDLCARRREDAFSILLAHHPHALEAASEMGLPLVFSGHTHGGQLMLTGEIGAGRLRFRYCSGVHRRGGSTLTIANGVGDWFPLRINAPAEIVQVVLRRGVLL